MPGAQLVGETARESEREIRDRVWEVSRAQITWRPDKLLIQIMTKTSTIVFVRTRQDCTIFFSEETS